MGRSWRAAIAGSLIVFADLDGKPGMVISRAWIRSLLLPNELIYEPFFLPSPPASGGEGSGVA